MKYSPILFSSVMVNAIIEDKKKQTRRTNGLDEINKKPDEWKFERFTNDGLLAWFSNVRNKNKAIYVKLPYGPKGSIMWVRESFREMPFGGYEYKANPNCISNLKWKPSIHMPKEAARIFLKSKNIKLERLKDITENDCKLEGADQIINMYSGLSGFCKTKGPTYRAGFAKIWFDINGMASFHKNPWVFVYEFKVIDKPKNFYNDKKRSNSSHD